MGWFYHVAYMRTCRKGIEKYTPVLGPHRGSDLHACRHRGRPDSVTRRMYVCTHTWVGPWSRSRSGPTARISMLPPSARYASSSPSQDNNAWIPFKLSAVLIVAVCAVSSRSLDVDSLDGAAKGDGETDNNVDATCAWGRGAGTVVVFVLEKKSVIKIR